MQYSFHKSMGSGLALSSLTVFLMTTALAAQAASSDVPAAISTPTIKVDLEPYSPDGKMRLYTVAGGTSYWTKDMPIYAGDSVKIDIFVATGANDLQQLKLRLDNTLIATISQAPWSTTISADKLTPGYHFIETWAQVSGAKPSTPQFATNNFTFFVSPPDQTPASAAPVAVSQVKGQEQILQNGQVTNVPLENTQIGLSVPSVIVGHQTDDKAKVTVQLNDEATDALLTSTDGGPIAISQPAIVSVVVPPGSTAQDFVYTIERGDQTIETAGKLFASDTTHIRIQPRTQTTPGMLDGVATLYVWGVDTKGNYGRPVEVSFNVINAFGG